jgi:hypothetical protein
MESLPKFEAAYKLFSLEAAYKPFSTGSPDDPTRISKKPDILTTLRSIQRATDAWLQTNSLSVSPVNRVLSSWEGAVRWLLVAEDRLPPIVTPRGAKKDKESLRSLEEKIELYRSRITQLKQIQNQLRTQAQNLLQQATTSLQTYERKEDTSK